MPDRSTKVRDLQMADRHIADAYQLISKFEILIHRERVRGGDVGQACRALRAMQAVLDNFIAHRAQIRKSIADIDAGKL